ncbi:TBC1 domain family member 1 isoform X2 [Bemisia tabaci]
MELFVTMNEQQQLNANNASNIGRSLSNAASLTSLCADISPSSSHFFEVLYVGKIRVSHKKVSETFIDDALDKFKQHDLEKRNKILESRRNSQTSDISSSETNSSNGPFVNSLSAPVSASEGKSGSEEVLNKSDENNVWPTNKAPSGVPQRLRAGSVGNLVLGKSESLVNGQPPISDLNRTMLFQVGRSDLRLISPDRKQILLHKNLKDLTCCIQGKKHNAHFGFICHQGDPNSEVYIGYVFKCESESVADEVVAAINQAYGNTMDAAKKEKQPVMSCDHCPMVWFHKLCTELDGLSDKKVQSVIYRKLELLPEEEQQIVLTKLHGAETLSNIELKEQNELMMMLLRAHCESKQSRHVHDTAENRHEFLNQYLGGGTIFMKAKRSLTSSFDQLLKRNATREEPHLPPITKELSLPTNSTLCKDSSSSNSGSLDVPDSPRPRSSTIGSMSSSDFRSSDSSMNPSDSVESELMTPNKSPMSMMNIFLKVGNSPKASSDDSDEGGDTPPQGSWRQAIFNNVVTPVKAQQADVKKAKRDKSEYRALWQKAINQQLLLIRMEKENARLRARQEEATVKRIKLEYDDIGSCARENLPFWENIVSNHGKRDHQMILQAVRQGVPRSKRGEVWILLAEEYCRTLPPIDTQKFPKYNVPYDELLKQLTSYQHAILIDLGRTFPNHTYFMAPLGPGQLSLFNLLKAYSLIDPEVGYCQGLSFIAGVLLLHMSEQEAFLMLRHIMFRKGLRTQYLPDMGVLQVKLYQLSRLLHDLHPDLYAHFDRHDVPPTLYAAPWLLTLFSSQFPLGFVTRVFDLLFVENVDVLFRIIVALLSYHKDGLLACGTFETITDYIKLKMPEVNKNILDKVMKQVFISDYTKQLHEYGVEYHVLQEEMSTPRPEVKKVKHLEQVNKALMQQNKSLSDQLEMATSNVKRLESWRAKELSKMNRLEMEVRSQEITIKTLGNFISKLAYENTDIEVPSEVLRIITTLNTSERRKSITKNPITRSSTNDQLYHPSAAPVREEHERSFKSTISSPNLTSKVSSFFNSHNQFRNKKTDSENPLRIVENQPYLNPPEGLRKSLSDSKSLQLTPDRTGRLSLGRVLTDNDLKSLKIAVDHNTRANSKSSSMPMSDKFALNSESDLKESSKPKEAPSPNDENANYSCENLIHPLDSHDVNISFSGTTKLKSIKPLRPTRSETSFNPVALSNAINNHFSNSNISCRNSNLSVLIESPTGTPRKISQQQDKDAIIIGDDAFNPKITLNDSTMTTNNNSPLTQAKTDILSR